MKRKTAAIKVLAFAAMFVLPSLCLAGALANAIKEWEPAGIYGKIIFSELNKLVVKEQNIMIVNDRVGKTTYTTAIMDINGKPCPATELAVGKYVIVKGSFAHDPVSKSNVVVAKEIYVLPREMTDKEMEKYPILNELASPWK
jgi:hypothetical protein